MDFTKTNRLDLSSIVRKQMADLSDNNNVKPVQVANVNKSSWSNNKKQKTMWNDQLYIQDKIGFIVAHVHSQLRARKPLPQSKPIRQQEINTSNAIFKVPSGKLARHSKLKQISTIPTNRNVTTDIASDKTPRAIINKPAGQQNLNIPRIKVLYNQKQKARLQHSIPLNGNPNNHFVTQQRFEDAKRQHKLFESMLEDQKQLKLERQSIAQEIFTMRSYLDDIRGRLDSSLKKLEDNKTYSDIHAVKGKK